MANSYTTTSTPGYNPDYKKQYDAARQLVEGRYQQAENKLQEDYSAQQPAYTQQKNYINQQAAQTGKQMENYYANQGLARSGSMVGARANINNAAQTGINNVNLQQQQSAQQLANRLAELRQGKATDLAALEGREGQDLRNFDLQLAQLFGNYQGQQTMEGQYEALRNALAEAGLTGVYNGQQTLAAQQQALQKALAEAGVTGQYQGQQTLAAQQLAQQIAQQMLANKYTQAGLTGQYDGQNTLARQQQEWAQNNARDLLATQLWSAYMQNAPNAAVPQSAVNWITQMFGR